MVVAPTPVNVIPLGTEFELRVSYHDDTGAEFIAGSTELRLRATRADLASIRPGVENSSFFVSTRKSGSAVIKVWTDCLHKTSDYIKLHINNVVTPVQVSYFYEFKKKIAYKY